MVFLIRWGVLFGLITVLGIPFVSRQFAPADDVVLARGTGTVTIDALANDKTGFLAAVNRLAVTEPPRYGSVTIAADGTMTYQPDELVTVDAFTYEATTTSGGTGSARVIVQRQPGTGVSVTAPVDMTAALPWWWLVVAALAVLTGLSLAHRLRARSVRRQFGR